MWRIWTRGPGAHVAQTLPFRARPADTCKLLVMLSLHSSAKLSASRGHSSGSPLRSPVTPTRAGAAGARAAGLGAREAGTRPEPASGGRVARRAPPLPSRVTPRALTCRKLPLTHPGVRVSPAHGGRAAASFRARLRPAGCSVRTFVVRPRVCQILRSRWTNFT